MSAAHVITLQPPWDGTAIFICCSCRDEPIAKVGFPEAAASLVEVNHIVHEHIEAAEREESYRELSARAVVNWPRRALHPQEIRPAPYEPICECGHSEADHAPSTGFCLFADDCLAHLPYTGDFEHDYLDGRSGTIG